MKTDLEDLDTRPARRFIRNAEATLDDLRLEDLGLIGRIETDQLPENGVATSLEIREGLDL